jgi:hypothetical protein
LASPPSLQEEEKEEKEEEKEEIKDWTGLDRPRKII